VTSPTKVKYLTPAAFSALRLHSLFDLKGSLPISTLTSARLTYTSSEFSRQVSLAPKKMEGFGKFTFVL